MTEPNEAPREIKVFSAIKPYTYTVAIVRGKLIEWESHPVPDEELVFVLAEAEAQAAQLDREPNEAPEQLEKLEMLLNSHELTPLRKRGLRDLFTTQQARIRELEAELAGLRRTLDEALNSRDGSYRP